MSESDKVKVDIIGDIIIFFDIKKYYDEKWPSAPLVCPHWSAHDGNIQSALLLISFSPQQHQSGSWEREERIYHFLSEAI